MGEYSLTRYEMETIINTNSAEPVGTVYTRDKTQIRRIQKIIDSGKEGIRALRQTDDMLEVEVPKSWIKIRPPRTMTEEQKAAAGERMRAMWKNREADEEEYEDDTSVDDID